MVLQKHKAMHESLLECWNLNHQSMALKTWADPGTPPRGPPWLKMPSHAPPGLSALRLGTLHCYSVRALHCRAPRVSAVEHL